MHFSTLFLPFFSLSFTLLYFSSLIFILSFSLRFNKPILADIVGDAARNLLQSISDSAGTARARSRDRGPF